MAAAMIASAAAFSSPPLTVRQPHLAPAAVRTHSAPRMLDAANLPLLLYDLQLTADEMVSHELQALTATSALTLFGAGLLTSLTPCCLSTLPLTFAFLAGGATGDADSPGKGGSSAAVAVPALAFTAGNAGALAALGVLAASLGKVYGDTGSGTTELLRAVVSVLTIGLGLNLLQLLPMQLGLGSLLVDPSRLGVGVPPAARAFLFGASSALVASPCASPVLASILGYVAAVGDPLLGGALLLTYTLGYTAPVLLTSLLATSARDVAARMEGRFDWFGPSSGAFLVGIGCYNGLVAVLGPV